MSRSPFYYEHSPKLFSGRISLIKSDLDYLNSKGIKKLVLLQDVNDNILNALRTAGFAVKVFHLGTNPPYDSEKLRVVSRAMASARVSLQKNEGVAVLCNQGFRSFDICKEIHNPIDRKRLTKTRIRRLRK
ncbi:MAG: hypothetical protein ABIH20_03400 [Candidatus Diapherotrites archaeon]